MNSYLLDVNILIALLSPVHNHHIVARRWFETDGHRSWLTCPMTENGVVRIMSNTSFSGAVVSPGAVAAMLVRLTRVGNHRFVSDSIRLIDDDTIVRSNLLASRQVTDTCLLASAVKHNAVLATLDRRLSPITVRNGEDHLLLL